jgi:Fe-S-cluster-containing dehydrogenase component
MKTNKAYGLVANLDRCIGCYACVIACEQEHKLTNGWIQIFQLGPKTIDGTKRMEFVPMATEECTLCKHRISKNLEPFCVYSCPVNALKFLETSQILECLVDEKRYHLCKIMEV